MSNQVKFVSFYTDAYKDYATILRRSLEQAGLNFELTHIPDFTGSWVEGCGMKSSFIRDRLLETKKGEIVVWIDADAQIITTPRIFFDTAADFAIRAEPGAETKKPVGREIIHLPPDWPTDLSPRWFNSGTMAFRNCDSVRAMVETWCNNTGRMKSAWDQWTLQDAWAKHRPITLWLDREYCQIGTLHGRAGAVILHRLASVERKVKRT